MRRVSRVVHIGSVAVGGDNPVSVQSMLNSHTADIEGSLRQIERLAEAGCEIVRLAVPDTEAAEALPVLVKNSPLPLVADIHFDHRLALASIRAGVAAIRLNPGNIGGELRVKEVAQAARAAGIPIRIGVNGGSLERELLDKHHGVCAEALTESALGHAGLLEKQGFHDIKLSLKASSVPMTVEAYRKVAALCDYPLHIGLTEAGGLAQGTVKSAVAMGILLSEGIGDTIRVSLTADPVEEVKAALEILNALELRAKPFEIISCPTCGRTESDLFALAAEAERRLGEMRFVRPLKIAVMGCAVNGPGEARDADFGIACGREEGILFAEGELLGKFPQSALISALIETMRSRGAFAPDR